GLPVLVIRPMIPLIGCGGLRDRGAKWSANPNKHRHTHWMRGREGSWGDHTTDIQSNLVVVFDISYSTACRAADLCACVTPIEQMRSKRGDHRSGDWIGSGREREKLRFGSIFRIMVMI